MNWARLAKNLELPYISGPISNAWQLIALLLALLCCGIYKCFDFNETYFTIHSFFAPKTADTIIFYVCKVLKTFNCRLNHNREFTMITGKTLRMEVQHFLLYYYLLMLLTQVWLCLSWIVITDELYFYAACYNINVSVQHISGTENNIRFRELVPDTEVTPTNISAWPAQAFKIASCISTIMVSPSQPIKHTSLD